MTAEKVTVELVECQQGHKCEAILINRVRITDAKCCGSWRVTKSFTVGISSIIDALPPITPPNVWVVLTGVDDLHGSGDLVDIFDHKPTDEEVKKCVEPHIASQFDLWHRNNPESDCWMYRNEYIERKQHEVKRRE